MFVLIFCPQEKKQNEYKVEGDQSEPQEEVDDADKVVQRAMVHFWQSFH